MTAAILLQSCTQTDELMFSCDKGIDNWVKDNISDIQEMSRAEWNMLPYSEQIAVFRAFAPEKKFAFWAEKFEELKQLPWTPAELAHIELAEHFLHTHPNMYTKRTEQEEDELDTFYYTWTNKAKEELHWSDELTAAVIIFGNTLEDTKGKMKVSPVEPIIPGEKPDCNCYFWVGFCPLTNPCERGHCNVTSGGCGLMGGKDCDGTC